MSMTNEELAKAIEGLAANAADLPAPWQAYKGAYADGHCDAREAAAALVRANAPVLRPASEATVGEDVMVVVADGDVVKAKLVPENAYSSARFERGDGNYWWFSEVRGFFPVPEFAKAKGGT